MCTGCNLGATEKGVHALKVESQPLVNIEL